MLNTEMNPLEQNKMKVASHCIGATAVCVSCSDRRLCPYWENHLRTETLKAINRRARHVMDTPLKPGLKRKTTMSIYVLTIARHVSKVTGELRRFVFPIVNSTILQFPSATLWDRKYHSSPAIHGHKIYWVKLEDVL